MSYSLLKARIRLVRALRYTKYKGSNCYVREWDSGDFCYTHSFYLEDLLYGDHFKIIKVARKVEFRANCELISVAIE